MIEYLYVTVCYLCFNRTYAHVIVFIGMLLVRFRMCPYVLLGIGMLRVCYSHYSYGGLVTNPTHLSTFPEPEAG